MTLRSVLLTLASVSVPLQDRVDFLQLMVDSQISGNISNEATSYKGKQTGGTSKQWLCFVSPLEGCFLCSDISGLYSLFWDSTFTEILDISGQRLEKASELALPKFIQGENLNVHFKTICCVFPGSRDC